MYNIFQFVLYKGECNESCIEKDQEWTRQVYCINQTTNQKVSDSFCLHGNEDEINVFNGNIVSHIGFRVCDAIEIANSFFALS